MQKDFITATPDSGGSGSTTVTATAPANQTESARSTSLSVAVGTSDPVSAGNNTWTFKVWPTTWYQATGGDGGGRPALVPGYYCQGTITVGIGSNTATVKISGNV